MRIGVREKIALSLVCYLLILLFLYFSAYVIKKGQMIALRYEVQMSCLKLNEVGAAPTTVLILEKKIKTAKEEIPIIEKRLHIAKGIPQVMDALTQGTRHLDIEVISISPLASEEIGEIAEFSVGRLPVRIKVRCPYRKLGEYISLFKDMPIPVEIDSVNIERNEKTLPNLEIQILINTYIKRN